MQENRHRQRRRRVEEAATPMQPLFEPSDGACLPFAALGAALNPPTEVYEPHLEPAAINPPDLVIVPAADTQQDDKLHPVYLMRAQGATEAYARVGKTSIKMDHHGPGWGEVFFAVVYKRDGRASNRFMVPTAQEAELVAIKKLNRQAVDRQLKQGDEENPYREICRMRALGDDEHVLSCRDALQGVEGDNDYIYIVTRKGEETLADAIFRAEEPIDPRRARTLFLKILKILGFLEQHGIAHRDLSPDNFLFLTRDNLVVYDLALSHRVPVNDSAIRTLTLPQGNFGTPPYMPPEIYLNRIFCGIYVDLWSAALILYNMLTCNLLYYRPHPDDIFFRYNILARGLSSIPVNERTVEVLQDVLQGASGQELSHGLFRQATAHLHLTPEAMELLEHLLALTPEDRWSLGQTMESAYVKNP